MRTPVWEAVCWGLLAGVLAGLVLALLRWRVPARAAPRGAAQDADEQDAADGGWDVSSALMAAIVIPVVMLVGFLVRGWLLVTVVLVLAAAAAEPSVWSVVVAIAGSIAVSASLELAVVHPLLRRWDVSSD